MRVEVKCFATLAGYAPDPPQLELADDSTVATVLERLGLDLGPGKGEVRLVFVNGVHAGKDRTLLEGDKLGLFPAVGGG